MNTTPQPRDAAPDLVSDIADGLRRRLADIVAAGERLDAFAFEPGAAIRPGMPGSDDDAVRDLMLRALRCASDAANYAMLRRLRGSDASLADLGELTALPRPAVSERVNDLLQVGLVARSHRGDEVGLTPAGAALVAIIESVAKRP